MCGLPFVILCLRDEESKEWGCVGVDGKRKQTKLCVIECASWVIFIVWTKSEKEERMDGLLHNYDLSPAMHYRDAYKSIGKTKRSKHPHSTSTSLPSSSTPLPHNAPVLHVFPANQRRIRPLNWIDMHCQRAGKGRASDIHLPRFPCVLVL